MPHTSAPRGKRIYVVLKNGETFVDKFIERRPHHIVFAGRVVEATDIQKFAFYREPQVSKTNPKTGKNKKPIKVEIILPGKKSQKLDAKNMQEVNRIINRVTKRNA